MILPLLRWSALRRHQALATLRDYERLTGRRGGFSDLPWGEVEERYRLTPENLAALLRPIVADLAARREIWRMLREQRQAAITLGIWPQFRDLWRDAARSAHSAGRPSS